MRNGATVLVACALALFGASCGGSSKGGSPKAALTTQSPTSVTPTTLSDLGVWWASAQSDYDSLVSATKSVSIAISQESDISQLNNNCLPLTGAFGAFDRDFPSPDPQLNGYRATLNTQVGDFISKCSFGSIDPNVPGVIVDVGAIDVTLKLMATVKG